MENSEESGWVLELKQYGLTVSGRVMLQNINLQLPPRGVTALVGDTGGGKSVLMRSLARGARDLRYFVDAGHILYKGEPLSPGHRPSLIDCRSPAQAENITVAEYIEQRMAFCEGRRRRTAPPALETSSLFARYACRDLQCLQDHKLSALSPGQFRRLAIVAAAMQGAAVLLAYDPTAGLDEVEALRVLAVLSLCGETAAVLAMIGNPEHACAVAQQLVLVEGGRLRDQAAPDQIATLPAESPLVLYLARSGALPQPEPAVATGRPPAGLAWMEAGRVALCVLPDGGLAGEPEPLALQQAGVTALIAVTDPDAPEKSPLPRGLRRLHKRWPADKSPPLEQLLALMRWMDAALRSLEVLALQGDNGCGGAGLVAASWWVFGGMSVQQALARLLVLLPGSALNAEQEWLLHKLEAALERHGRTEPDRAVPVSAHGASFHLRPQGPSAQRAFQPLR